MGIKTSIVADFRPLKHQFLEMDNESILLKMKRMSLQEGILLFFSCLYNFKKL